MSRCGRFTLRANRLVAFAFKQARRRSIAVRQFESSRMASISEKLAMGLKHHQSGQFELAESAYREVLISNPRNAQALYYLGILASQIGNKLAAVELIGKAIEIDPSKGIYYYNLGEALQVLGKLGEAVVAYRLALQRDPSDAEAQNNLGRALQTLGNLDEAIVCYRRTLELRPNDVEALNNLGGLLQTRGDFAAAIGYYETAIQLRPDYVEVYCNLGSALKANGQPDAARKCFVQALRVQPKSIEALNGLIVQQQELCCWQDLESMSRQVIQLVETASEQGIRHQLTPLSFLSLPTVTTPAQQLNFTRDFFANRFGNITQLDSKERLGPLRNSARRIRVGYLSGDLQTHPVGLSICELLESHDRARFEVFAYSFGIDDHSITRQRIVHACNQFVDLGQESFGDSAKRINRDGIDILVDLMGYTYNARTEILALRPAPIQIQYLGFPGTMGAPCVDYLIADDFVVPMDQSNNYSEQIIRLPHCFFPKDSKRSVSGLTTARSEHGLLENAIVLCSFNSSNKITPTMFGVWMRILRVVPDSILWIYVQNDQAAFNLQKEAVSLGVDSNRLVFARRLPNLNDHLARYCLVDLFLDTFPYNAHSTAADALWMGCPVLTLAGQTFASRVAGSLLREVEFEELVTNSLEEYESKGIALARDASMLTKLRTQLERSRSKFQLTRNQQYARLIERAFEIVWDRHLVGQKPAPVVVESAEE